MKVKIKDNKLYDLNTGEEKQFLDGDYEITAFKEKTQKEKLLDKGVKLYFTVKRVVDNVDCKLECELLGDLYYYYIGTQERFTPTKCVVTKCYGNYDLTMFEGVVSKSLSELYRITAKKLLSEDAAVNILAKDHFHVANTGQKLRDLMLDMNLLHAKAKALQLLLEKEES